MTETLRLIQPEDNAAIAALIRTVMPEFGARGEGYAINDPEVDAMAHAYTRPNHIYYVIESSDGVLLGGGGVAPLTGADSSICELRKMYFYPELRGLGWGSKLLARLLNEARHLGFNICYLETLERMTSARALYAKFGFNKLCAPMGNTGHHKCDAWFAKDL